MAADTILERFRDLSNIPTGTTGVTLSLETENNEHAEQLIEHLKNKQIDFKVIS